VAGRPKDLLAAHVIEDALAVLEAVSHGVGKIHAVEAADASSAERFSVPCRFHHNGTGLSVITEMAEGISEVMQTYCKLIMEPRRTGEFRRL
jgi:hypothetical protein